MKTRTEELKGLIKDLNEQINLERDNMYLDIIPLVDLRVQYEIELHDLEMKEMS